MACGLAEDACVGLEQRSVQVIKGQLFLAGPKHRESLERVQQEVLNGDDGQSARDLAGTCSADPIRNQEDVNAVRTCPRRGLWNVRLVHGQISSEIRDHEPILVRGSFSACVTHAVAGDRQSEALGAGVLWAFRFAGGTTL